jgi:uncharacterized protein YfdQ (DUF2303 family)
MIDLDKLRAMLIAGTAPYSGVAILPKDMTLASLEPFERYPRSHTGTYQSNHAEDFLAYIAANADQGNNPHVFFTDDNLGQLTATAVFDFGSTEAPAWRNHRATFTASPTDAYTALLAISGKPATQKALLDFIDDHGDRCAFNRPDGSALAPDLARNEFANLTAEKIRTLKSTREDFNRQLSAIEKLTLGNSLPNRLTFVCAPWDGFSAHAIRARISADDSGSGLLLNLTITGFDTIKHAMTDEFRQRLLDLKAPITVLRGHFWQSNINQPSIQIETNSASEP